MNRKGPSFRIGRVRGDRRGRVWYLTYHEQGRRHRPRVGHDRQAARQLAAQINAQLELGTPAALSFEPIPIRELRQRWLGHHEQVLRSSVQTIGRYRSATNHLLTFLDADRSSATTSHFSSRRAEEFVRYLRALRVSPNGHPHTPKRPLLDKGIKYILETCRSMFHYAIRYRHLPPYTENPFTALDLDRIPVENSKPVVIFSPEDEEAFLRASDDWQFPLFLTLMLTGLRPGELAHLLLPDDLDLTAGVLRVRNKPRLGWQVKTRNEREIPLVPSLVQVLRVVVGHRVCGPVFLRRRFTTGDVAPLCDQRESGLERELVVRVEQQESGEGKGVSRAERLRIARTVWRGAGSLKTDRIRVEFLRITKRIGHPEWTAPKMLRHLFATSLQDGNVDPLIRCELMGHSTRASNGSGHSLGMTATYTHTRSETKRRQLEEALERRPAVAVAETWLRRHPSPGATVGEGRPVARSSGATTPPTTKTRAR